MKMKDKNGAGRVSGSCVLPDTVLIITFHSEILTIKIRRHKKKTFLHETAACELALDGRGQDLTTALFLESMELKLCILSGDKYMENSSRVCVCGCEYTHTHPFVVRPQKAQLTCHSEPLGVILPHFL